MAGLIVSQNMEFHQQKSTRKVLPCPQCDRKFSRPSHLDRHLQTHLPSARRQIIQCPQCDRSFSRYDVLLRHQRAAHSLDSDVRRSTQKSCLRCIQKKLKCDRAQTCQSCSLAKATCSYRQNDGASRLSGHYKSTQPTDTYSGASDGVESSNGSRPSHETGSSNSATGSDRTSFWNLTSGEEQTGFSPPDFNSMATCSLSPGNEGLGQLIPSEDGYNSITSEGNYFSTNGTTFASSSLLSPNGHLDFRASALDWLDFHVPDLVLSDNSLLASSTQTVVPPVNSTTTYQSWVPRQSAQSWPFDQTHDLAPHRYQLPPLRVVLQGALQSHFNGWNGIPEGLLQLFSEPWLPPPESLENVNSISAFNLLKGLVDVFFTRFHPIQPVTHIPTWNMATCPTVLLAAMACIGAMLSDDPSAAELSEGLSKICIPMITWLGASDSANYCDISYLNSLCLHQIYSLGSGSRQLYQNADRSRGVLIGGLRGIGLLNSHFGIGNEATDAKVSISADSSVINNEWLVWASRERDIRTAWASFEYDCSLCTLTSRRGAVDLNELPQRLPCAESLWEAPSSTAWAALRSRFGPKAMGVPFSNLVAAALAGKPLPEHTSFWAKRLCSQVIGRLLWDLKQLEIISMRDCFGLASLSTAQRQPKASLLVALDNLLESMDNPISTADLISYNITSLLCHYSHLYSAKDVMDFTLYIVRNVVTPQAEQEKSLQTAEQRLRSTFAHDQQEARKLLWHAAQIVAVANEYLVSAPCEILRLFMGYVYIIAFSKYFPRTSGGSLAQTLPIRLDISKKAHNRAISQWIDRGGPVCIGSARNVCSDDAALALSQDAQSTLQRLRCWGLAEKFVKILSSFSSHNG